MKITTLITAFCVLLISSADRLSADGTAGGTSTYETRFIVDMPTAGIVRKGDFAVRATTFGDGGLMAELTASPFRNFNMGLSVGGTGFIGDGDVIVQSIPGIHIKLRAFDETLYTPAFTIGANTQGYGRYSVSAKRFRTLSPGIFLAASKNFEWFAGQIALHAGINYSFEPPPADRLPNFYAGLEQTIGSFISVNLEYNANLDEYGNNMKSRGLLNASLRWAMEKNITILFQLRDMLGNLNNSSGYIRYFVLEYSNGF